MRLKSRDGHLISVVVGENIRRAQRREDVTTKELSWHAGMATFAVREIQFGRAQVSLFNAHKICQVLAIPLDALFGDDAVEENYWKKPRRRALKTP